MTGRTRHATASSEVAIVVTDPQLNTLSQRRCCHPPADGVLGDGRLEQKSTHAPRLVTR